MRVPEFSFYLPTNLTGVVRTVSLPAKPKRRKGKEEELFGDFDFDVDLGFYRCRSFVSLFVVVVVVVVLVVTLHQRNWPAGRSVACVLACLRFGESSMPSLFAILATLNVLFNGVDGVGR